MTGRPIAAFLLVVAIVVGCGGAPSPSALPAGRLEVTLVAGPVCPVETVPPDPACAPRPVADREILVLAPDGREVARGRSDAVGNLAFLLAPGDYVVRAGPADGFPTPPADEPVRVGDGAPTLVTLSFDTGIR